MPIFACTLSSIDLFFSQEGKERVRIEEGEEGEEGEDASSPRTPLTMEDVFWNAILDSVDAVLQVAHAVLSTSACLAMAVTCFLAFFGVATFFAFLEVSEVGADFLITAGLCVNSTRP